ncbi:hypothetical protein EDB80DRAFT_678036 [Ilyonectria destructans]|nr:hypothetical protein EDB80DRAFT_678036 [Ilyonectria destructans]
MARTTVAALLTSLAFTGTSIASGTTTPPTTPSVSQLSLRCSSLPSTIKCNMEGKSKGLSQMYPIVSINVTDVEDCYTTCTNQFWNERCVGWPPPQARIVATFLTTLSMSITTQKIARAHSFGTGRAWSATVHALRLLQRQLSPLISLLTPNAMSKGAGIRKTSKNSKNPVPISVPRNHGAVASITLIATPGAAADHGFIC